MYIHGGYMVFTHSALWAELVLERHVHLSVCLFVRLRHRVQFFEASHLGVGGGGGGVKKEKKKKKHTKKKKKKKKFNWEIKKV